MSEPLAIYLHDHLGAANFALELLAKWRRDTKTPGFARWAGQLHEEISADREVLRQVIERIGEPSHSFKEALGWMAEKMSRKKLSSRRPIEFARFEGLEVLSLGILGKLSLWETLQLLTPHDARLGGSDYAKLEERARRQHADVDRRRLEMGRAALLPGGVGRRASRSR
jgi:hypothetical protein